MKEAKVTFHLKTLQKSDKYSKGTEAELPVIFFTLQTHSQIITPQLLALTWTAITKKPPLIWFCVRAPPALNRRRRAAKDCSVHPGVLEQATPPPQVTAGLRVVLDQVQAGRQQGGGFWVIWPVRRHPPCKSKKPRVRRPRPAVRKKYQRRFQIFSFRLCLCLISFSRYVQPFENGSQRRDD